MTRLHALTAALVLCATTSSCNAEALIFDGPDAGGRRVLMRTDIGAVCYAADDQTVAKTGTCQAGTVVDATLIAQQPKLAPHAPAMVANIATDLGIAAACVNVKGKTNEKLGYLGRAEAIEAQAVVLLTRAPA